MPAGSAQRFRYRQWLRGVVPRPNAQLRLFCFPFAGGGATEFGTWAEQLSDAVEVWPVQLPGREERLAEAAFDRLPPLLDALIDVFAAEWRRPFALFGHSMGALVAFELARELRRRTGCQPARLFLSGRGAPRYRDPMRPVCLLPEAEFIERLRELNGTPEAIVNNREMREVFFPTLRADFAVCERYRYREDAPLACAISVLGGSRDEERPPELLQEWRKETSGPFVMHMFPGDHFFLRTARKPVLDVIARDIEATIGEQAAD